MPRKTRYGAVLSKLPATMEWALGQDIGSAKSFLLADDGLPRIFLGSGGSLSVAQLAMQRGIVDFLPLILLWLYSCRYSEFIKMRKSGSVIGNLSL